jgi:hypothetical protein
MAKPGKNIVPVNTIVKTIPIKIIVRTIFKTSSVLVLKTVSLSGISSSSDGRQQCPQNRKQIISISIPTQNQL